MLYCLAAVGGDDTSYSVLGAMLMSVLACAGGISRCGKCCLLLPFTMEAAAAAAVRDMPDGGPSDDRKLCEAVIAAAAAAWAVSTSIISSSWKCKVN
jgi:hypothetical protein